MAAEQDATGTDEMLEVARWMRQVGSVQPGDLVRAADSDALDQTATDPDATRGDRMLERVLRVALRLLGTVLGSVRVLVLAAVALAVIDAGLFLLPRRDESLFLFGAAIVLLVALLPALMLNRLGKRFAAFRDAVTMVGTGIPTFFKVPEGIIADFQDLAPLMEKTAGKRLPGRIIGSARVLLRLKKLITTFIDEHRDLFSATTTVFTYGPKDVLLAVWGISGTVALALAMPVFALWAILA